MNIKTILTRGHGVEPGTERAYVRFTEAAGASDIVMFDFLNTATGLSSDPGGDPGTSIFNTVRQPDAVAGGAATIRAYWYGVAEKAQGAASDGWVVVRGIVDALSTTSVDQGDCLVPTAGADNLTESTGATDSKIVGIALADADATSGIGKVLFDGISGFGVDLIDT